MRCAAFLSTVVLTSFTLLVGSPPAPDTDLRLSAGSGIALPSIASQPQSQTVTAGQNPTFSVAATGGGPFTCQWTSNGANAASSSSAYTRTNCQLSDDAGRVQVTVIHGIGSVTSGTGTLSANPPGTNYFVATNGSSGNTGLATNSPWPLNYALTRLAPGITLTLMPGAYPGTVQIYYVSGTALNPATVRSQYKWQAVIANSTNRGVEVWSARYIVLDGLCVSNCLNTGIKVMDSYNTVRNCWSTHNGNVSDQDGIEAGNTNNLLEYNLIEWNGSGAGFGHGIYVSGQNNIVRGNVVRHNGAFGIHVYTGSAGNWQNNNLVYNNLVYGHTNKYGVTIWGADGNGLLPGTNYLFSNTILDGVSLAYGTAWVSNNIILPSPFNPAQPLCCYASRPPIVGADYNLGTVPMSPAGAHNVIRKVPGSTLFVNLPHGLYWLSSGSPARNAAANLPASVDFFGRPQSSLADIGAFQYSPALTGDIRVLDPSPANPDYWSLP
jgi:hypothetical protein